MLQSWFIETWDLMASISVFYVPVIQTTVTVLGIFNKPGTKFQVMVYWGSKLYRLKILIKGTQEVRKDDSASCYCFFLLKALFV